MTKKYIKKMLEDYKFGNPIRYHMPGHKGSVNACDTTEISATDNLNDPENCILKAQTALTKSYNSACSFFMVNGSTGAIQAMIKYAGIKSSKPILISRNSHKSVFNSALLFNIDTIIINEKFDDENQTFVFDEGQIINAINENDLSAVVVTSVDYFGRVIDISNIAALCKEKGVLLLCDEAHGAHFHISDKLPGSALKYADICVHSPHKTLSALTQCSYVHIADSIDVDKFKSIMTGLQTSSPSFLLVESMDNARYDADTMQFNWENRVKTIEKLCEKIDAISDISVMDKRWAVKGGYIDKDITRLVIDVSGTSNGIEIGSILEQKYNIFMEMTTLKYIVGILTPWDNEEWDEKLFVALSEIANMKKAKINIPAYPQKYNNVTDSQNAVKMEWKKISLENAAGKTSAVPAGVYPPGVSLILPGEEINKEIIEYMLKVKSLGGSIFGASDGYINCIKNKGEQ